MDSVQRKAENEKLKASIEGIDKLLGMCKDTEVCRDLREVKEIIKKAMNSKSDASRQAWMDRGGKLLLSIKREIDNLKRQVA